MASGMLVYDSLGPALDYMAIHQATEVHEAMERGAERIVAYGQANAPWADRTGMARNTLSTRVYVSGGEVVLEFAHGVDYGQWLELIQDGRFAIIMPTLEMLAPEIMAEAGAMMVTVPGGGF